MLPALLADAARQIGGIGPMLEIVPAGGHQSCRQRGRPLFVGLGEPKDLIGGEVTKLVSFTARTLAGRDHA